MVSKRHFALFTLQSVSKENFHRKSEHNVTLERIFFKLEGNSWGNFPFATKRFWTFCDSLRNPIDTQCTTRYSRKYLREAIWIEIFDRNHLDKHENDVEKTFENCTHKEGSLWLEKVYFYLSMLPKYSNSVQSPLKYQSWQSFLALCEEFVWRIYFAMIFLLSRVNSIPLEIPENI